VHVFHYDESGIGKLHRQKKQPAGEIQVSELINTLKTPWQAVRQAKTNSDHGHDQAAVS
jgi:hypothetical protein